MAISVTIEKERASLDSLELPCFVASDSGDLDRKEAILQASMRALELTGESADEYQFSRISNNAARVTFTYKNQQKEKKSRPETGSTERGFQFQMQGVQRMTVLSRQAFPNNAPTWNNLARGPFATTEREPKTYNPPPQKFWIRFFAPRQMVNDAYIRGVGEMVGTINSHTFRGYAPGELLLTQANGTLRDDESWQLYFAWAFEPLIAATSVNNIAIPARSAFDDFWTYQMPSTAVAVPVPAAPPLVGQVLINMVTSQIAFAYIDEVFPSANHNSLRIPA
jgi:hypothetical protein